MRWIHYQRKVTVNHGTADAPVYKDHFVKKAMSYSEANLALVREEACNGEYTIEDDGTPEVTPAPTAAERITALEAAIQRLYTAVTGAKYQAQQEDFS